MSVIYDMQCILGHKFCTKLEISIQKYTFELDNKSKKQCFVIILLGEYKYKCLCMGLKCDPDFTKQVMEQVLWGLNNVKMCLYNNVFFSKTNLIHLLSLKKVLSILTWSQWFHSQCSQVWMGHQRNQLAWLMLNPNKALTIEEKNFCYLRPWTATQHQGNV